MYKKYEKNKKRYKYIEMHVEKYLFEIIRVYKKTESIKLCKMCTKRM